MNKKLTLVCSLLAVYLGLITASPTKAASLQRGRPKLNAAHTTFVADNGQDLRGPYTSTEWTSATSWQNIANMKNLGFNAVHLYAESFDMNYPNAGSTAPGYSVANVDVIVAETRTNGLYLIITIGNGANNGNYNAAYITNFWKFYAPRYANETHVLYEIQNEPVAWGPPYSAANATPPGGLNMEIAAYNTIRTNAPNTPVLLFTYAVFGGTGGASAALTDIHAFNTAVFGNANQVWTNEAVAFHGYNGWQGTSTAVSSLLASGYPCMMTEYSGGAWGSGTGGLDAEMTSELERLGVSWLTFQYVPPTGVSDDVSKPQIYSNIVVNSGLSWSPDYGNFPPVRGPYGNGGQPRTVPASYVNNFLTGTPIRIQAEDFDTGGEGVAYHELTTTNLGGQYRTNEAVDIETTTDTGDGYDVTGTATGEWIEYTIWVQVAGYYNLSLRYATPSNGCAVQMTGNGHDRTGTWVLPSTGGSTTWATATQPVLLEYGRQKMHINILNGGFNLNWMELTPSSTGFVPNGTYKFLNGANGLALTALTSTNLVGASNYVGSAYQQWNLQHVGGNQYKITAVPNGYSWNVNNNGLLITSSGWGTGGNQCYILAPTSGGFYSILPVGNGVSLETSAANPAIVDQKAYSGGANQQWVLAAPSAPMFPVGLSATAISTTQVSLVWNAVTNAASYNVKRSAASGGPYTTIATGVTTTNYTDTVPVGMIYYYVVSAVAGGVESPNSSEAPANLLYPWMTQDVGTVGVTGSASLNNSVFTVTGAGADIWGTSDAFRYVYVPVTGDCTMIAHVTSVQNVDPWSKAGVMIRESMAANAINAYIAVTPGNGVTWQTRSTTGGATGNAATAGLTAPYWVKLVRSGSTFTGYRSPDGVTWTQQGTATINMASAAYIGLALTSHNSSTLCTATFDNVTAPGWPNPTPPYVPASLTAMVTNWNVGLTWTASTNTTSYNVKRAVTYGGPYIVIANVTTTNYTDTSLANGQIYYYAVSALNLGGESANSPQAIVNAQGFAPTGLSASAVSSTQVGLVWNAFTNATSYNVKRSPVSGGPYATIATGVTATSYTDTVPAGMIYYYVVNAVSGGVETLNSSEATLNLPYPWMTQDIGAVGVTGNAGYGTGVFTVTGGGADIQGTGDAFRYVYVTATGDCTIIARVISLQNINSWSKAGVMIRESLAANAANAYVAVTPGNGVTWQYRSSTGGGTSYNNTSGLSAPYWVKLVRSGNTFTGYRSPDGVTWTPQGTNTFTIASTVYVGLALTSHDSANLATATFDNVTAPGWPNSAPPPAPHGLTATVGNGQAALIWLASSSATSYNVKRSTINGGPYAIIANVTTTNYTDPGLNNGTNYYYVVSALNLAGESANSVQAGGTPQAIMPVGLTAAAVSSSQINLVWNTFTNATSYNVKRSLTNVGSYTIIASGVTATNYQDTGLAASTMYYYVVSAVVGGTNSADSAQATAMTFSPTLGSLVHRYSFSETGGTTVADSVGGSMWAGTLPNGGTLSGGQLMLLSRSQQYANLSAGIVGSLSNCTVMAWVTLASVTNSSRIFDFGNDTGTYMFLTPQNGSSGTVQFAITTGGSGAEQQINGSARLSTLAKHQVAVTMSRGTGILYVDGMAVGTNSSLTLTPSSLGNTVNNYIGKSQSATDPYLNGWIDEFRIYNVGLSSAEIAATAALGSSQLLSTNSPAMGLELTGTNLTVSWPVGSAGFTVQARTNLVMGDWVNITSPAPQIVSNQWQVMLPQPSNAGSVYYRLMK
jgi:endoglucanase